MSFNTELFAGAAKIDITPALGCLLFGYSVERRAERIMDPLSATAIAVKQNDNTIILISAELCLLSIETTNRLRTEIAELTGVKWENVIIGSIHTHSGPITITTSGWGPADYDYIQNELPPKIKKIAVDALNDLKPAVVGVGTSQTLTGINRREIDKDGNVILGQNPNAPYDPTMTLVCFKATDGEYIGSFMHFGAHPTAAARNVAFTRDWPSLMIDKVEQLTSAPAMFFNGAIGDVGPRLSNGRTTGGEEYVIEAGLIAAKDIEVAFNNIKSYDKPKLSLVYGSLLLTYVEPPTREFAEERVAFYEAHPDEIEGVRASQYDQMKKVKEIYESGNEFPKGVEIPQTLISLGDLAIVPAPFEAFCNIALALREKSPFTNTIMLGVTNGHYCYLPTEDQLEFGGYEVDSFKGAGIVSFVDDTDKHFINQNVKLLNDLYKQYERN